MKWHETISEATSTLRVHLEKEVELLDMTEFNNVLTYKEACAGLSQLTPVPSYSVKIVDFKKSDKHYLLWLIAQFISYFNKVNPYSKNNILEIAF